jgi:hypothetical protein
MGSDNANSTYKVPMRKIRADHCAVPVKRANALKRLVTEFHWDGEKGLVNA